MALSVVRCVQGGGANPPSATTFGFTVPAGDVLVAEVTVESGDPLSATFSDTINGIYNTIGISRLIGGTPYSHGAGWIQMHSQGNPTISVTLGAIKFGYLNIFQITGFLGAPALDTALTNWNSDNTGTSTVATINCTNNFFPEACMTVFYSAGGVGQFGSSTPGWINATPANHYCWGQIPSSIGQTDNFSNTLVSAQKWAGMLMGIYDQGSIIMGGICL